MTEVWILLFPDFFTLLLLLVTPDCLGWWCAVVVVRVVLVLITLILLTLALTFSILIFVLSWFTWLTWFIILLLAPPACLLPPSWIVAVDRWLVQGMVMVLMCAGGVELLLLTLLLLLLKCLFLLLLSLLAGICPELLLSAVLILSKLDFPVARESWIGLSAVGKFWIFLIETRLKEELLFWKFWFFWKFEICWPIRPLSRRFSVLVLFPWSVVVIVLDFVACFTLQKLLEELLSNGILLWFKIVQRVATFGMTLLRFEIWYFWRLCSHSIMIIARLTSRIFNLGSLDSQQQNELWFKFFFRIIILQFYFITL